MIDSLIQFILMLVNYIFECLFVIEKLSLIGFTSFGFAQNTTHDFQKIELIVALSSIDATKSIPPKHCLTENNASNANHYATIHSIIPSLTGPWKTLSFLQ